MSKYKIAGPTKAHHEFVCWCEDTEGVAEFDWSSTMPAANKVLYAKFREVEYEVELDANGGTVDGTQDETFRVKPRTILSKTSLFQNTKWADSSHELVGWFYKDGPNAGKVYDYGEVLGPVKLIAKWRIPGQVQIIYDYREGATEGPEDSYKYATDSSVVVAAPPKVKEGYVFEGWKLRKDTSGTTYYPNSTFDITEGLIEDYVESEKTGKIYLDAVYHKTDDGPFEKTYIRWFKNDGDRVDDQWPRKYLRPVPDYLPTDWLTDSELTARNIFFVTLDVAMNGYRRGERLTIPVFGKVQEPGSGGVFHGH